MDSRWHKAVLASSTILPVLAAGGVLAEESGVLVLANLIDQSEPLRRVATNPAHEVQIVYTRIDRDDENRPVFRSESWGLDKARYFYPASTVKLPAAILALEKLARLSIESLTRDSEMRTEGVAPAAGATATPSIANHIRDVFLVSDNAAYNRLFEFVEPDALSAGMQERGFAGTRIFHRVGSGSRAEGETALNAIEFFNASGHRIHAQPGIPLTRDYASPEPILRGVGYLADGQLIREPKDFANLNAFPEPPPSPSRWRPGDGEGKKQIPISKLEP